MNMMAGPPLFKRAIVQVGEARTLLHPSLSQDLDANADALSRFALLPHHLLMEQVNAMHTSHKSISDCFSLHFAVTLVD